MTSCAIRVTVGAVRVIGGAVRVTGDAVRAVWRHVRVTGGTVCVTSGAARVTGSAVRVTGGVIRVDTAKKKLNQNTYSKSSLTGYAFYRHTDHSFLLLPLMICISRPTFLDQPNVQQSHRACFCSLRRRIPRSITKLEGTRRWQRCIPI